MSASGTGGDRERDDASGEEPAERRLHARIRVRWTGWVVVVAAVLGVGGTVLGVSVEAVPVWAGGAAAPPVLVAGLGWVWLRYRLWGFRVGGEDLFLTRGVFVYRETVVPYVRVQHVDTHRDPIDRVLGLSTLVVYTAGSRGADVAIPGLRPEEASDLQRRLKALAIDAEEGEGL